MAGLVIHDLDEKDWEEIKDDYAGWTAVTETTPAKPCIGCKKERHKAQRTVQE